MFKGRNLLTIAFLALILLTAYWVLVRRSGTLGLLRPQTDDLPLNVGEVMPDEWEVIPGKQQRCDFDMDQEDEWLVFYRYDTADVQAPLRAVDSTVPRGPIGAVVFDRQTNVTPEGQGNPSLYRPTLLVPYRLLPDFYGDKGQGYVGEIGVTEVETIFYPPIRPGAACRVEEISILGYSDSKLPTRVSIFRWQGSERGFQAAHFAGNARIAAAIPPDGAQVIREVTTLNRLGNHRSLLCESRTYLRAGRDENLLFNEVPAAFTVDFCFNAPPDPTHPEGVVVSLLRGGQPKLRQNKSLMPPTEGFLTKNAVQAFDVGRQDATGIPILVLSHFAAVNIDPSGGRLCTAEEGQTPGTTDQKWVCGRERAVVETEIMLEGQVRLAVWYMISFVPDQVDSDVHWRVERVDLP